MKKSIYVVPQTELLKVELEYDTMIVSVTIDGKDSGITPSEEEGDGSDQATNHFDIWENWDNE